MRRRGEASYRGLARRWSAKIAAAIWRRGANMVLACWPASVTPLAWAPGGWGYRLRRICGGSFVGHLAALPKMAADITRMICGAACEGWMMTTMMMIAKKKRWWWWWWWWWWRWWWWFSKIAPRRCWEMQKTTNRFILTQRFTVKFVFFLQLFFLSFSLWHLIDFSRGVSSSILRSQVVSIW